MQGLLLLLVLASPIVGLGALVVFRWKPRASNAIGVIGAAWAFLGGAILLAASMRFWSLYGAGQTVDYVFDTHEMARGLTVWGAASLGISVFGVVLIRRRLRKQVGPS